MHPNNECFSLLENPDVVPLIRDEDLKQLLSDNSKDRLAIKDHCTQAK